MNNDFVEVDKKKFYDFIGPQNASCSPKGKYPYTMKFHIYPHILIGYQNPDGKYFIKG
jgi:hypothetical protein